MKRITLICCLLMLAGSAPSVAKEGHLIRANYYYNHGDYYKAIPHLEKVAEKSGNVTIYARLGDCYYVTNDLQKATKAYSKAVASKSCKKEVWLKHAQVLMQLGQYDDAQKWLTDYKKAVKNDSRVDGLIDGCRTANAINNQIPGGLITLLPINTDGSEFAPTRWKDMLVFASDANTPLDKEEDAATGRPFYDIFYCHCDDKGNCATEVKAIDGEQKMKIYYHTGPCTFSADGKTMYYTRSSYSNKKVNRGLVARADSLVILETMIASCDNDKNRFGDIHRFEHNSREYAVAHVAVSPNGKVLALTSNMPKGKGRSDIYICKKMGDGAWSEPVNAGPTINTEGDELFPYWADDATLSFSSDGHPGLGGLDIYTSKWEERTNAFTQPENIGIPINSSYDDISLAIKTGEVNTWFSSNRPAEKRGDNIYFFRKMEVYIELATVDSVTRQPVSGVNVSLASIHRKQDTVVNNSGKYTTRLYPGDTYTINATIDGYLPVKTKVQAITALPVDTLKVTIELNTPKLQKDTISSLLTGQDVLRNKNVMDSPGIRNFTQGETYEVGDFKYEYGKYELDASHQPFLDTMLAQLNRNPSMHIEIQAHTDCRGSVASNKILSDKHALSVVNYFVQHGISKKRLEYQGLGNTRPKVNCPDCNSCTEKQHSLNRILEFKVLQL